MKRFAVIVLCLLLGFACKKEPPPAVQVPALELVAEDASCTEAWLRIRSLQVPATVQLIQVAPTLQTKQTLRLTSSDSLVIDEGLLPRRTYTYKAQLLEPQTPNLIASTPDVHVTTMDTTNHNFTWQIDTLGDGGGSVLYDVAIINDTLAYAVGEIYKRDSVGNWDSTPYGLATWNGRGWTLKKLFAQYPGVGSPSLVRPHGIYAFSETNIWFADADVFWWDGQSQLLRVHQVVNTVLSSGQYVDKLWGSSPSNIYAVGANGAIAHYDGVRWRRIEITPGGGQGGTALPIMDIYGAQEPHTGEMEILALASASTPQLQGCMVLKISGTTAIPLSTSGMASEMHSLWFMPRRRYYAVGAGIHQKRALTDSPWVAYPPGAVTHFYSDRVRGQDINDVHVVGDFGEVVHYNGKTWMRYFDGTLLPSGVFGGLAIQGDLMMAVGFTSGGINTRAIILTGRR